MELLTSTATSRVGMLVFSSKLGLEVDTAEH
jgi:hypothetical protein